MTLCGNVTMTQLALGIDPEPLSMAPFIVTAHELPPARAADFGVGIHPRAPAFVFRRWAPTSAATSSRGCSRRA
jgi:hypothetical protein